MYSQLDFIFSSLVYFVVCSRGTKFFPFRVVGAGMGGSECGGGGGGGRTKQF